MEDDLYNQIMKKIEEKKKAVGDVKSSNSDAYKTRSEIKTKFSESEDKSRFGGNYDTSRMIEKFLEDEEENETKKPKKIKEEKLKTRKSKKDKKQKYLDELENEYIGSEEEKKDIRKTRILFIILIIIQLALLSLLGYMLYNKVFETQKEILSLSPASSDEFKTLLLMEGQIEIPKIKLYDNVYEKNEKLDLKSMQLFETLNGLNKEGNSVITAGSARGEAFHKLKNIKTDDKIYIELENEERVEYIVKEVKEIEKDDFSVLVSKKNIQLTLITHSNSDKRFAVIAEASSQVEEKPKEPEVVKYRVITDQLNVRPEAGYNNTPIGSLVEDQVVVFKKKVGDWYQIEFKGKTAYVLGEYLKIINEKPKTPEVKIDSEEKQLKDFKEKYEEIP